MAAIIQIGRRRLWHVATWMRQISSVAEADLGADFGPSAAETEVSYTPDEHRKDAYNSKWAPKLRRSKALAYMPGSAANFEKTMRERQIAFRITLTQTLDQVAALISGAGEYLTVIQLAAAAGQVAEIAGTSEPQQALRMLNMSIIPPFLKLAHTAGSREKVEILSAYAILRVRPPPAIFELATSPECLVGATSIDLSRIATALVKLGIHDKPPEMAPKDLPPPRAPNPSERNTHPRDDDLTQAEKEEVDRAVSRLARHMEYGEDLGPKEKIPSVLDRPKEGAIKGDEVWGNLVEMAIQRIRKFAPYTLTGFLFAAVRAGVANQDLYKSAAEWMSMHVSDCNPQDLTMLLWAFSRSNNYNPSFFTLLGNEVRKKINDLRPLEISTIMNAFTRVNHVHASMNRAIAQRFRKDPGVFGPTIISRLAASFVRLQVSDAGMYIAIARRASECLSVFTPQDLSELLRALAATGRPYPGLYEEALKIILSDLPRYSWSQCVTVMSTYNRIGQRELLEHLGQAIMEYASSKEVLRTISVKDIAVLLAAFDRYDVYSATHISTLLKHVQGTFRIYGRHRDKANEAVKPQMASLLITMGRMQHLDAPAFMACISALFSCSSFADLESSTLAQLVWALTNLEPGLHLDSDLFKLEVVVRSAALELLAERGERLASLKPPDLAALLAGASGLYPRYPSMEMITQTGRNLSACNSADFPTREQEMLLKASEVLSYVGGQEVERTPLPPVMRNAMLEAVKTARRTQGPKASKVQQDISKLLKSLGIAHSLDVPPVPGSAFTLAIRLHMPGSPAAAEFTSLPHFSHQYTLGPTSGPDSGVRGILTAGSQPASVPSAGGSWSSLGGSGGRSASLSGDSITGGMQNASTVERGLGLVSERGGESPSISGRESYGSLVGGSVSHLSVSNASVSGSPSSFGRPDNTALVEMGGGHRGTAVGVRSHVSDLVDGNADYAMDFGAKIAIQVLGPEYFSSNLPFASLGPAKLEKKHLGAIGWKVGYIPEHAWVMLEKESAQMTYLKAKLVGLGLRL